MKIDITFQTVAGFLAMAALLAAGNLTGIFYLNRFQHVTEVAFNDDVSSLLAAERLESAIWGQRRSVANYLLNRNEEWVKYLHNGRDAFASARQYIQRRPGTLPERDVLRRIDELYGDFTKTQDEVVSKCRQGQKESALVVFNANRERLEALLKACREFTQFNVWAIETTRDRVLRYNAVARLAFYGVAAGGMLLGGLLGVIIARSVTRPIAELVLKVRSEGGDIAERVEFSEDKGLGSLRQGVESLMRKVKSVSAELARSEEMLIQAEKLAVAGQLAAGIAHEIRNPLTAIKTMVFALEEDLPSDSPGRADFDVISQGIDQMERSIQRLLDFARPPEPAFAPVYLSQPIADAAALVMRKAHGQGVQIEVCVEPDSVVQADRRQMEQVFVNLMLNALQVMPEGGNLSVTARKRREVGRTEVAVEVADTGSGIPEELMERLFEPFVTGREEGTGLGLAIVRKVVDQHGGRVTARNRPEGGAVFTVALPLVEEDGA